MCQRHLSKMSSRRTFFFKIQTKIYFYLLISCFFIFSQNDVSTCHSDVVAPKMKRFYNVFTTSVLRRNINVAAITSFSCIRTEKRDFWSCLEQLSVYWWQIRQGCGLITFSVVVIKRRGYNICMLWWYFKTILNSLCN